MAALSQCQQSCGRVVTQLKKGVNACSEVVFSLNRGVQICKKGIIYREGKVWR